MHQYIIFVAVMCILCKLSEQRSEPSTEDVRPVDEEDEEDAGAMLSDNSDTNGYSFHKFSGPVSGEVQQVYVPDVHLGQRLDFIAKPDYSFSYGVNDPATGNSQDHQEARDGDAVHGQYSVLQADGKTRVVRYTADALNGFQATVMYH